MKSVAELARNPQSLLQSFKADTRRKRPEMINFDVDRLTLDCPKCGGLGVYTVDVPVGDPLFGKSFPCRESCCKAGYDRYMMIIQRHFGNSGLPHDFFTSPEYSIYTFGAWDQLPDDQLTGKKTAYSVCRQLAEGSGKEFTIEDALSHDWPDRPKLLVDIPRRGVMLTGNVGVGKTSLAMATVVRCLEMQIPVLYTRLDTLISKIQETYDPDSEVKTSTLLDLAQSVTVLVVDEFNLHLIKDDRLEKLESIIRMRDAYHLRTLATTNLGLDEFYEKWGDRIGDIMAKAHWVTVGGIKLRKTVHGSLEGF